MDNLGCVQDSLPEVLAKILGCTYVYLMPQEYGRLSCHTS
jgi:hypothetical protein